jgi:hypothetical protein
MPNSYRIRTQLGTNKTIQVKLDQDYEQLEILSLSLFPNDVYTRSCADFGVICGRVFCNRGLGLVNARVAVFIPIEEIDENNPIISTLYPYKSFEDFNEDGYKYNLLPYSQSHSGHVPVGTFPERIDALVNAGVVEVYDKYYKFTAKTNDAGDYMIFGVPTGQYDLFMQVDVSDIGEFSLTPQDLIRLGRATEAQVNGTKFKFSENYSELPQIITLKKVIQVAPFYGQDGICNHYIVRADFDLTSEAQLELRPTSVFIGSLISDQDKRKLKRRCRVPAKQGWLCNLVSGPGQIQTIRQTINTDADGRPVLEQYRLENDGKVIDENGTWVVELPMNLDYTYTDEFGERKISLDGSVGVPTRGKYRFKIKWQQSPSLREETKRGYFLVPNIKEYGWNSDMNEPSEDPAFFSTGAGVPLVLPYQAPAPGEQPSPGPFNFQILLETTPAESVETYINILSQNNIDSFVLVVNDVERPDITMTIPLPQLVGNNVYIKYTLVDPTQNGALIIFPLDENRFKQQSSYAFSLSWSDYGTFEMIDEAINCEDRFYQFTYNKVYTVSQLIDRYSNRTFPQKSIQIKHILDDKCEGDYNPFPTNDSYFRYDIFFIIVSFILSIMKFIFIPIMIFLHVLALLWPIFAVIIIIVWAIQTAIYKICTFLQNIGFNGLDCKEPQDLSDLLKNPFKNIKLPLFLYTEDGCERCRCRIDDQELDEENNTIAYQLQQNLAQLEEGNISNLADINTISGYDRFYNLIYPGIGNLDLTSASYNEVGAIDAVLIGNSAADPNVRKVPFFDGAVENADGTNVNIDLFSLSLPLAERLNLFNTKAKYFDNATEKYGEDETPSPGNAGWNQCKVTINPGFNNPNTEFHFDNLLILLVENTGFTRGDILTFQDPELSADVNYNSELFGTGTFSGTTGFKNYPEEITVRYANPNLQSNVNLLEQIYNLEGTIPVDLETNQPLRRVRTTTCYPTDIEYFQVVDVKDYYSYLCLTRHGDPFCSSPLDYTPGNTSDRRFSLPWRFLRSDRLPTNIEDVGTSNWWNCADIMRTVQYTEYGQNSTGCNRACISDTTHISAFANTWGSFILDEQSQQKPLFLLFVRRGVDINSPTIPHRIDLRRYYGDGSSYLVTPEINGQDISSHCIVTVGLKVNQPILPGGFTYDPGYNVSNTSGWVLRGYAPNQQLPFGDTLTTYQFLSTLREEMTIPAGQILPLNPLQESPNEYVDYFSVFDIDNTYGGVFTPPNPRTFVFKFFLKFQGIHTSIGGNAFLQVFIRDLTLNQDTQVGSQFIDGTVQTWESPWVNLTLIAGNDYAMYVRNRTNGNLTLFIDESNWPTSNPYGLRLPRHNRIQNNEFTTSFIESPIYFPSSFFNYAENYQTYNTEMPNYYSALDIESLIYGFGEYTWNVGSSYSLGNAFVADMWGDNEPGSDTVYDFLRIKEDAAGTNNMFAYSFVRRNFGGRLIPCSWSVLPEAGGNSKRCGTNYLNYDTFCDAYGSVSNPQGCCRFGNDDYQQCDNNNNFTKCPGCCALRESLYDGNYVYHATETNRERNKLSGYWGREYVEGGSAIGAHFIISNDFAQVVYSTSQNCSTQNDNVPGCGGGNLLFWNNYVGSSDSPDFYGRQDNGGGNCVKAINGSPSFDGGEYGDLDDDRGNVMWGRKFDFDDFTKEYISPVYSVFRLIEPPPGTPLNEFYVNPTHFVTMSNQYNIVMRTDRLPASTDVQTDGAGNGYVMHQNGGFAIFKISSDCSFEQLGGGFLETPISTDLDFDILPDPGGNGELANVAASLSYCTEAVDLNSYYISGGVPGIHIGGNGYSSEPATGADWLWFVRGMGCYNIVSKPLRSLFPHDIEGDPYGKKYSDFATIVEWTQRLKLTFALCFDVFSHTFSNNWINGTLYAFTFQNLTTFNSQNQPQRDWCRDVIYFHDPTNTFYYRSSPWNGVNFVGRPRFPSSENNLRGNIKNLLYPTTILDMGPKAEFIQELVFSDEYDGFIVHKVPSTSFQDVSDILNLLVLSRLVNTNFIQQLIPLPDAKGNEEGSDDPSVGAFFANTRWQNGEAFFASLLPGLVDGDYAQLISINSEFGVLNFDPFSYQNTDIFFGYDIGTPGVPRTDRPVLGLFFSGDNQDRDYISPRRTIWDRTAEITSVQEGDFTEIEGVVVQEVPFYQWNIFHEQGNPPTIFGYQSNNFITDDDSGYYENNPNFVNAFFSIGYQQLDRWNGSSEYFNPDGDYISNFKGFITNYIPTTDSDGDIVYLPNEIRSPDNIYPRHRYTFGAPYHFYFGLIKGASAMDRFIQKYIDTDLIYE